MAQLDYLWCWSGAYSEEVDPDWNIADVRFGVGYIRKTSILGSKQLPSIFTLHRSGIQLTPAIATIANPVRHSTTLQNRELINILVLDPGFEMGLQEPRRAIHCGSRPQPWESIS